MRAKWFSGSASLALRALLLLAATAGGLPGAVPAVVSPGAPARHYVCTPCNLPCDDAVYDAPGVCPKCGMPLVEQGAALAEPHATRKKVAILIFDGVQIIDYTGPYEVFGAADFDV